MARVLNQFYGQIPPQETMIDVGSGPTIYQVISTRRCAREITMSDYLAGNREEIKKWMNAEEDAFNWDRTFTAYAELEGNVASPEVLTQMKAELRARFKGVVRCDVRKRQTLGADSQKQYDIVSSHYVAESITNKETIFVRSLRNVINLAKKDGYLLLSFLCESNQYQVGGTAFSAFPFRISFLMSLLEALNCEILESETLYCEAAVIHQHGPLLSLLARRR
jgi:hypothetical protein